MDALRELEISCFAGEADNTEQKLQESAARQQAAPLSETYLDQRIGEQEKVQKFNEDKMAILGINTDSEKEDAVETPKK